VLTKNKFLIMLVIVIALTVGFWRDHLIFNKPIEPAAVTQELALIEGSEKKLVKEQKLKTKTGSSISVITVQRTINIEFYPNLSITGVLADHFDILLKRFNDGDMAAGLILGVNLHKCSRVPVTEDKLSKHIEFIYKTGQSNSGELEMQVRDNYNFCEGVSDQDRQAYYGLLTQAANAGYTPAQGIAPLFIDDQLMTTSFMGLPEDQLQDVVKTMFAHSYDMTEKAAAKGDLLSIRNMSYINMLGSNGQTKDLTKALAYNNVLLEFVKDDESPQRNSYLHDKYLFENMTSSQIDTAYEISQNLINDIYNRGTLYALPPKGQFKDPFR
jgi:hypothetical protein